MWAPGPVSGSVPRGGRQVSWASDPEAGAHGCQREHTSSGWPNIMTADPQDTSQRVLSAFPGWVSERCGTTCPSSQHSGRYEVRPKVQLRAFHPALSRMQM